MVYSQQPEIPNKPPVITQTKSTVGNLTTKVGERSPLDVGERRTSDYFVAKIGGLQVMNSVWIDQSQQMPGGQITPERFKEMLTQEYYYEHLSLYMTTDQKNVLQRIQFSTAVTNFQNSMLDNDRSAEVGLSKDKFQDFLQNLVLDHRTAQEKAFSIFELSEFFKDCFDLDQGGSAQIMDDTEFSIGAYIIFSTPLFPHPLKNSSQGGRL